MAETARQKAEGLIGAHGPEEADAAALVELMKAQQAGNNYDLSVWREVRRILAAERKAGKQPR